jgi:BA14K-like protein
MQFLVYLALLTVSVSTVLLEVHWLTSPAPQPKPIAQASSPPAPKTKGSNAAGSPVYPKNSDAPRSAESNVHAEIASTATPQPTGQDAPASPIAPTAPTTPAEQLSPTPQTPAAQQPGTAQPIQKTAASPQSHQATLPQAPTSQSSGTNEGSRQKSSTDLTGVAALREDRTRQAAAGTPGSMNRVDNPQQTSQGSSNNRCDVQACAKAYRSFRATDCTYQPLDGERRFCGQPRAQQLAHEQSEQRERRRWNRDTDAHYLDGSTVGRQLDNDDEDHEEFEDSDRRPLGFFLFGTRPRW